MSGSSCRAIVLAAVLAALSFAARGASPLQHLEVPDGFHVSICTDQVPDAREMALGTREVIYRIRTSQCRSAPFCL